MFRIPTYGDSQRVTYQVRVDNDGELHEFGPVVSSLEECTTVTHVLAWQAEQLQRACIDLTLREEQAMMFCALPAVRALDGAVVQALCSDGTLYEEYDDNDWRPVEH